MGFKRFIWDPVTDAYLGEQDETGATIATYTQEPVPYGSLISQRRGGQTSYYHYDGLGNTRELTSASEVVTDTNLYDAWGVNVDSTGTTETPFKWRGRQGYYFDVATADYYVRARTYRPATGSWMSADPLLFVVGSNLYVTYHFVQRLDPSGLCPEDEECPRRNLKDCNDALRDAFAAAGLETRCKGVNIQLECRNGCIPDSYLPDGFKGADASITCAAKARPPRIGVIRVCINSTGITDPRPQTNQCTEDVAIEHELAHVGQFCDALKGGNPNSCEDNERPAYEASCKKQVELGLISDAEYDKCVDDGVKASCEVISFGQGRPNRKKLCDIVLGRNRGT